jgi:hypothetical protein
MKVMKFSSHLLIILSQPDTFTWDSLQSPENIELSELDDMFDAFP